MSKSPAVILTCQFTLPNKKSFSTYIDYMTREKALEEKERRTPEEEQELRLIKNALEDFYIPEGETFSESKTGKEFSETSNEAQSLMKHGINFDKLEEQDFTKYLSYMTRHYALEQKKVLTHSEQIEYQRLNQAIKKYQTEPHKKASGNLPGVFLDLSQYLGHILVETVKPFFLLLILQIPVGLDSESSYGFDFGYKILQCS
ncbi:hypothetical protein GT393_14680 [Enterococcus durans]|nr:hypothetical protein [Enterococcus durans]MZH37357.1 hypothetical protein [Enterococcus durans]MZH54161.1 hypothetical protein [Enterococcus durans]NAB15189.1 hypothetical protein [Enterococcus durans]